MRRQERLILLFLFLQVEKWSCVICKLLIYLYFLFIFTNTFFYYSLQNPPNAHLNIYIDTQEKIFWGRQFFCVSDKSEKCVSIVSAEAPLGGDVSISYTEILPSRECGGGPRVKDYQIGNLFPSVPFLPGLPPPSLSFNEISFISTGSLRVKFHQTGKMIKLVKAIQLNKFCSMIVKNSNHLILPS